MTRVDVMKLTQPLHNEGLEDFNIPKSVLIKKCIQLEKENAELKVENAFCEKACEGAGMMFEQLTKAKNLLQKVADVCGYPDYDIPVELYADIADFLKDSEVEQNATEQ